MGFFHYKEQSMDFYNKRINNEITIGEAEKILEISRENNWTNITCRLLKIIAFKLFKESRYALCFDYLLSYVNTKNDIYKDPESAEILNMMAICQNYLNDLNESVVYLRKAEVIAKNFNNYEELKKVYYNLSITYGKLNSYDLSLECIKKSINISTQINDINYLQYARSCEANCYAKLNQLDKAINIYNDLLKNRDVDKATAYFYNNLACLYIEKGDFDKAKTYTDKSYKLRESYNESSLYETMKTKAYLFEAEKMYSEAAAIFEKITDGDVGYNYSIKIKSYKKLIELYEKQDMIEQERETLQRLIGYTKRHGTLIDRLSYYKLLADSKVKCMKRYIKSHLFKSIELSK